MSETLPGGAPRLTRLCDYVRHYAKVAPDREAVVFGATRLDYASFDRLVDRCAVALQRAGVGVGDRVAMLTTPRPEFAVVLMAAQRIGAIWVGLNTRYRLPELRYILDDCTPSLLISVGETPEGRRFDADLRAIAAESTALSEIVTLPKPLAGVGRSFEQFLALADGHDLKPPAAHPDDPTVIVYTSGTTGRPKGALLARARNTCATAFACFAICRPTISAASPRCSATRSSAAARSFSPSGSIRPKRSI